MCAHPDGIHLPQKGHEALGFVLSQSEKPAQLLGFEVKVAVRVDALRHISERHPLLLAQPLGG